MFDVCRIKITFNINNSVSDSSEGDDTSPLSATPEFDVEIIRGDTTLGFMCSYVENPNVEDGNVEENDEPSKSNFSVLHRHLYHFLPDYVVEEW